MSGETEGGSAANAARGRSRQRTDGAYHPMTGDSRR